MVKTLTRRSALLAPCAVAAVGFIGRPARAAQYQYKCANNLSADNPESVRLVQLWNEVARQTNGKLVVQLYPNNALGSIESVVGQLRLGAIEFMGLPLPSVEGLIPALGIGAIGFAFRSEANAIAAWDGALGDALRREIEAKGFVVVAKPAFDFDLRQITNNARPIATAADLEGLKIRVPSSAVFLDLFRTLGANPTPLPYSEVYTALQTGLVDGQEGAMSLVQLEHFYEVQKYLSLTSHGWSCQPLVASPGAWHALPTDVQVVVQRLAPTYIQMQRRDVMLLTPILLDKLVREGMKANRPDIASFRRKLQPYYAHWKAQFGPTLWSLLEQYTGRLT